MVGKDGAFCNTWKRLTTIVTKLIMMMMIIILITTIMAATMQNIFNL